MKSEESKSIYSAWVLLAAAAPAVSVYGGSWLPVLEVSVLCAGATSLVRKLCTSQIPGDSALLIWNSIFLGSILPLSASCWEGQRTFPIVPLVLLGTAAFASIQGVRSAARIHACLVLPCLVVIAAVMLAGIDTLTAERMLPEVRLPKESLVPFLLTPALQVYLTEKKSSRAIWWIPVLSVLAALWVNASLGEEVCIASENPFYEYCRGITLFGSVKRFEAILACILTVSWFSLISLILSVAYNYRKKKGVLISALISCIFVLTGLQMPGWMLVLGCIVFWLVVPILKK